MRTKLSFVVAFVAFVSSAFAQDTVLDFSQQPRTVRAIARITIETAGYIVSEESLSTIDPSCTWNRPLDIGDMEQALNTILPSCSNEAAFDDFRVTIRKRGSPAPATRSMSAPARRAATPTIAEPEPPAAQPAAPAAPASTDPNVWSAADVSRYGPLPLNARPEFYRISQQVRRQAFGDAFVNFRNAEEDFARRTGVYNPAFSGSVYNAGYGQHGYGAYGGYGYFPWMQGCQDGRPTAYLEFQYRGKSKEKHLWLVSINGVGPGTVDQGDTLSQKLPICSDGSVVVTVEKIGERCVWERSYSLRPFAPTEVPVGEFLFGDRPRLKC